jgi:plastocyanin
MDTPNKPNSNVQQNPDTPSVLQPEMSKKKGSKKPLLIILVVIVVLGVVTFALTRNSKSSNPASPAAHNATPTVKQSAKVSINASGFIPATIEVAPGTQVTWTNSDKSSHQVAADPYPKNDSIPGFNSNMVLNSNESFSFTFEKAGTYRYHDNMHPLDLHGIVIVK